MSYEGEHKVIPIRGIERAGEDNMIEDGATNEIIGMEYKDGSYKPYIPTIMPYAKYPQGTKKIYVHKTSFQENVIIIVDEQDESRVMWIKKDDFDNGTYVDDDPQNTTFGFEEITDLIGTNEMVFVGNMIVNDLQESVIFQNYNYISIYFNINSTDLPCVHLRVRCNHQFSASVEDGEFGTGCRIYNGRILSNTTESSLIGDDSQSSKEHAATLAQRCIGHWTEKGGLTGWCLATVAYRLTNGKYILASSPIVLAEPYVTKRNGDIGIHDESEIYKTRNIYQDKIILIPEEWSKYDSHYWIQTHIPDIPEMQKGSITFIGDKNYYIFETNVKQPYVNGEKIESPMLMGWADTTTNCYVSVAYANVLEFYIDDDIQDKYRSTIDSVCIFLSNQIPGYKDLVHTNVTATGRLGMTKSYDSKDDFKGYSQYAGGYWFAMKEIPTILEELKGISLFYKVKEIPFVEIKESQEWEQIDLKGKLGDNLRVQEILDIQAFSNAKSTGNIFTYNNQIHLFNYKQIPSAVYDTKPLSLSSGAYGQYQADTKRYSRWRIIAKCNNMLIGNYILDTGGYIDEGANISFPPLITYPNIDAYEIEFRIEYNGEAYGKIIKLSPKKELGLAVYWKGDLKPFRIGNTPTSGDFEKLENINNPFDIEYGVESIPYSNGIKVSESSYLYFPAEQTYQVGKGKIIGLATLIISLSQDTFGRYPVLVFCTDGIYSMAVNTDGTGAYTTITPFSREVCVNKNTICEIDGAVLFATDKGLMVATQQGVMEFCPKLNGTPRNLPKDDKSNGNGMYVYGNAIKHNSLIHLEDNLSAPVVISKDDFIDYLKDKDTFVSYVSKKNKIIVYNANKQYVYWIDIPSKTVTKLNMRICFDNNNYPTEEYYDYGKSAYQFAYRSDDTTNSNCLLQTRPIKISTQLKSSYRVVVRGFYNSILNEEHQSNYAGLYVMGSLDSRHWQIIGYKEKQLSQEGFHDLGCKTERVSMKYLMIVLVGKFASDTHIDMIELTTDNKYNNKLK